MVQFVNGHGLMRYDGPERREHRLFVTRNTEYHLRGSRCVGVRDRTTGRWHDQHVALDAELVGALALRDEGGWVLSRAEPQLGEKLCFSTDLLTSPLREIARPPREVVEHYRAA